MKKFIQIYRLLIACFVIGLIGAPCTRFQNDFFNILVLIGVLGVELCISLNSGFIAEERKQPDYRPILPKKEVDYELFKILLLFFGIIYAFYVSIFSVEFLFFKDLDRMPFKVTKIVPELILLFIFLLIMPIGHYLGKMIFKKT